jgi:hypothetical protein
MNTPSMDNIQAEDDRANSRTNTHRNIIEESKYEEDKIPEPLTISQGTGQYESNFQEFDVQREALQERLRRFSLENIGELQQAENQREMQEQMQPGNIEEDRGRGIGGEELI